MVMAKVRLRIFPFWDDYCNYLSRRDVYKNKVFLLSVWYSQSSSMVNVFGDSIGGKGLGNLQVLRKVIAISGKYADYVNGIQASHKLGYAAYRIAPEASSTLVFMYENKFFCLGAHKQHLYELTPKAITKTHYLAYWKEGSSSSSGGNAAPIKGNRGIRGKRGTTGEAGPIGPHGRYWSVWRSWSQDIEMVLDRVDLKEKEV